LLPQRIAPLLFGLILSGLMSLLVSGISMIRATGLIHGFVGAWTSAWLTAWLFAFPVVQLIASIARAAVARLTAKT
jgi:hypothetical protein